jgi:sarcosine oxidase subunit beta
MTKGSVIVVGGGIVGVSTAYFAAREGYAVTLFEQRSLAFGASGRNAGFVWLQGRNRGWALDASFAGLKLYEELRAELAAPFEFRSEGGMIYFTEEAQAPVFEEFVAARRTDGLHISLIDNPTVRELVSPIRPDVLGAAFCEDDAQINTPTVVQAIAAGARAEGATLHEGVSVLELLRDGERVVGVATSDGLRHADHVVVASGAWTENLMRPSGFEARIGRERLQVLLTEPLPRQIRPVVYGPETAKQYALFRELPSWDEEAFLTSIERDLGAWMLTLAAQRANGSILLGCPMDYPAEMNHSADLSGLEATLRRVREDFPGLRHAPVDRVWAGVLPFTSDMAPIIDVVAPGLIVAAGHVHGNATGPITGKLVSQLLLGVEPELDLSEVRWDRELEPIAPQTIVHW